MSVSAAPTPSRAVIADRGISEDTRVRVRQQPSWLLQQPTVRCQRRAAVEATGHPERGRRVVTEARKFDHITVVLRQLHWLPVRKRIRFKLAMTVYKCLHGLVPPYLADDCVLVSSVANRRHLRSADTRKLVVWRTRTILGARELAVCCAVVWNSLPTDL